MKKSITILFAFIAILFTTGSYGQDFVKVTKSNNGQTINLASNEVLEISLPRMASTGYTWNEAKSTDGQTAQTSIVQIGDCDFIHDANAPTINGQRIAGQSGTQIIRYAGLAQGTTKLTMELRRPWEKENPAIGTFTITIVSNGKYTGSYTPSVKGKPQHTTSTPKGIPSKWDWRPFLPPIRDQQQCGDCWAFAGVGTLECNIQIIDGVTRNISEAYLTNCYTLSLGCNGGVCPHDYWMAPKGAVYETDYPWTPSLGSGTTGTCGSEPFTYHETIDSYSTVPGANFLGMPPDSSIKSAIMKYGPVWVDVCASSGWDTYNGGIYSGNGLIFDHCVVLAGWCDSATVNGGGYWILRNSWGPAWGMDGYMYITYGSDVVGLFANYIVYKGGTTHVLSTTEFSNNENMKVYPVPATDNLSIECPQQKLIEIFNYQGQLIKTLAVSGNKTCLDIADLAKGIYFIKVKTEKGVTVRKFVKE